MIRNLPAGWDLEADVVAIGSGIGGLAAAITAHDHGVSALVLERSEQVGGVTALSMGEVWVAGNHHARAAGIQDSPDSGYRYLKRLAMDYGSDVAILNKVVHAAVALKYFEDKIGLHMQLIRDCPDYYYGHCNDSVAEGRMLEVVPFPAATLGEWQSKTRVSPACPYGLTHHDIFERGGVANMMKWDFERMAERLTKDERCLGPGLAAYFVKGALDRGIALHTRSNAQELICDGERVVGVRVTKDERNLFVKAKRGVVIAVSSYERNQDFNKTLGQQLELGSLVFSTVDGANFRLAGPVGARIARVPDITSLGFVVPGEEDDEGAPLWRPALPVIGQPHTIVVNRQGKRFGNEAFYRQFFYTVDLIDGGSQTHPNFPVLGHHRQPGAGKISVCIDHARPGLAAGAGRQGRLHRGARGQDRCGCARPGSDHRQFQHACREGRGSGVPSRHASVECLDVRRSVPEAERQPRYAHEGAILCGRAATDGRQCHSRRRPARRSSLPCDRLGRQADRGSLRCGQFGGAHGNRCDDAERYLECARHDSWLSRRSSRR